MLTPKVQSAAQERIAASLARDYKAPIYELARSREYVPAKLEIFAPVKKGQVNRLLIG